MLDFFNSLPFRRKLVVVNVSILLPVIIIGTIISINVVKGNSNRAVKNEVTTFGELTASFIAADNTANGTDNILSENTSLLTEETIWMWDQSANAGAGGYTQFNNTSNLHIAPGQGFFVRTSANSTITFKTTHQVAANNNQFYRSTNVKTPKKEGRSWFTFNRGNQTNTVLVGFLEGATNRYDRTYDAPFDINQKSLGFYSVLRGGKKVSIQGFPKLKSDKKVVKLGFVVDKIGEYTIKADEEHINSEYYIYLRDKEQKTTTDLRQKPYTFNVDSIGENNTRFKLIYTKKIVRRYNSSDDIYIFGIRFCILSFYMTILSRDKFGIRFGTQMLPCRHKIHSV